MAEISPRPESIHPDALELSRRDRSKEFRTGKEFNRLLENIRERGITWTWNQYLDVMDTVRDPQVIRRETGQPSLSVNFATPQEQKRFCGFTQRILAGTSGPTGLIFYPGETPSKLEIDNFGHADLVTLGRVGTALFLDEYGDQLQQNIRLLKQRLLIQIADIPDHQGKEFEQLLPEALQQRLRNQAEVLGDNAGDSLLTSGIGISRIGRVVRKELGQNDVLVMQRDKKSRPAGV